MLNIYLNNFFFINWNQGGLIPVIIQEVISNNILMFAWFNFESLFKTIYLKNIYYYSRSKFYLWNKGDISHNIQYLKYFYLDCDIDIILLKILQIFNISCHLGNYSCFLNRVFYFI